MWYVGRYGNGSPWNYLLIAPFFSVKWESVLSAQLVRWYIFLKIMSFIPLVTFFFFFWILLVTPMKVSNYGYSKGTSPKISFALSQKVEILFS